MLAIIWGDRHGSNRKLARELLCQPSYQHDLGDDEAQRGARGVTRPGSAWHSQWSHAKAQSGSAVRNESGPNALARMPPSIRA